ncbi:MAG: chemotaxis protein CheW [Pseudomonadales bacterium]|nr:chemotaxis protein CheW [Pseudomonadales bacterium]NRA17059.1 chemotaxis protein CheW [Oceanospirillaceae bacterium]
MLAKAVASGLVSEKSAPELFHQEILQLIFNAGLSTAENVSAVSGRGVGMDAVKRKVEEIKGTIQLQSEFGKGTDLTLSFHLTMVTLKVSLFKIAGVSYAIPSADITQIIRFSIHEEQTSIRFDNEQAMLHRNGKIIPLIEATTYLDSVHNSESIREAYSAGKVLNIIVFLYQGNNWGLCVDEVFAYMDIVIKPMDSKMNPLLFSGVAVLGNGDLALVMNPKGLLDCYLQSIKEIAIDNAKRAGA